MRRNKASYYGMIELIDRHYGRIIDALDEMGLRENTIVIFNSDHGEMLGDHGLTHKGCRFYEGITHVPLIISLPGTFRQNAVYGGLVEQTDLGGPPPSPTCAASHQPTPLGAPSFPSSQGRTRRRRANSCALSSTIRWMWI